MLEYGTLGAYGGFVTVQRQLQDLRIAPPLPSLKAKEFFGSAKKESFCSLLEDAEFAKSAAIKARQGAEAELEDVQSQLEEVLRTKNEAESRCLQLAREKGALQVQLEEMEEEQAELMKKYKAAVQQMQSDQKLMIEQTQQILDLESEKHHLKEQVQDLNSKMDHLASQAEDSHAVRRLEAKVRELESRLELEQTAKARLEVSTTTHILKRQSQEL
ncbi:hypothetical protein HPB48_006259 [Haemaphysalis longicornis]|uniref:Uncharacterized protein n=1 Tax=Haemaphysalis longicornis TaxID=44386 RepID=A0A9J6GRW8_HAELO|nr:hypothetical protein HPB48_006259 [Haemaphysalis longicornis]